MNQLAVYRSLFRSYASHARYYRATYQKELAMSFHVKALATLAMIQWLIDEGAK